MFVEISGTSLQLAREKLFPLLISILYREHFITVCTCHSLQVASVMTFVFVSNVSPGYAHHHFLSMMLPCKTVGNGNEIKAAYPKIMQYEA